MRFQAHARQALTVFDASRPYGQVDSRELAILNGAPGRDRTCDLGFEVLRDPPSRTIRPNKGQRNCANPHPDVGGFRGWLEGTPSQFPHSDVAADAPAIPGGSKHNSQCLGAD